MKTRMMLLLQSFIGLLLIICVRVLFAICPTTWNEYSNSCYKVLNAASSFTYSAAVLGCRAVDSRANIVMPKTVFENSFIETQIQYGDTLWLGLRDIDLDGVFFWDDGTELLISDFAEWDDFQPDNNDPLNRDEICVIAQHGDWHDKPCILNAGIMCQMKPQVESTTPSTLPTQAQSSTPYSTDNDNTEGYYSTLVHTDAIFSVQSSTPVVTISTESYNQITFSSEVASEGRPSTNGLGSPFTTTDFAPTTQNTISTRNCTYPCPCHFTLTHITLEDILNDIRVQKELLSSETRKKISASDSRISSFCIGCTGVSVLIACVLFIICLDFSPKWNESCTF